MRRTQDDENIVGIKELSFFGVAERTSRNPTVTIEPCQRNSAGMPCLILIRVPIQELYTLRNAIYKTRSVLENGYQGLFVGVSNDVERLLTCDSPICLNFGLGLFYFCNECDARSFIYSDQGFMEVDFLENSEIMIIPMLKPLLIGRDGATLLFTELLRYENTCQLTPSSVTFDMEKCGAVPNIVDTVEVTTVRSCEARSSGFRISQFPCKKVFYEWVKSESGAQFREDLGKIRSLDTYIATFARDIIC
ncbi:hypothetical protein Aperf_G00000100917 [Anoplocephala perfoliata]